MHPIVLRGVRTRNLQGIDVSFEPGTRTTVVGVSGSGKTSLCFGTLHALSQQRFLSAMAPAARALIEALPLPILEGSEGLCPTLALEQGSEAPSRRSRAVELCGIELPLRSLFVARSQAHSPQDGAALHAWTPAAIAQSLLDTHPGTKLVVLLPAGDRPGSHWSARGFTRGLKGDAMLELDDLEGWDWIVIDRLVAEERYRSRLEEAFGLALTLGGGHAAAQWVPTDAPPSRQRFADHPWCPVSGRQAPRASLSLFSPNSPLGACPACKGTGEEETPCPTCEGTGLGEAAGWYRIADRTLPDLMREDFATLRTWLEASGLPDDPQEAVRQTAREIGSRLECLERLGVGYLQPGRRAATLSLGELHRLRLAHLTGAPLSGVCYVLDEPSTGLHPRDAERLEAHLDTLTAAGNTLVVIDHRLRDLPPGRILELGPLAGEAGGRIVYDGSLDGYDAVETLGALARRARVTPAVRREFPRLRLEGAEGRNLKDACLELSVGGLTGVCGPSGAGKSTLLLETLVPALRERQGERATALPFRSLCGAEGIETLSLIDPTDEAVSSPRSTVATLTGLLDPLRTLMAATPLAKAQGMGPGRFSPNQKGGRCEPCQGLGRLRVDLPYLPAAWAICPHCGGTRFARDVLEVRWRGLHLGQILALTCAQALERFSAHPPLRGILEPLVDAGLGHLTLDMPSASLSGGEVARLRLCAPLGRRTRPTLFVLDEPTRGLHPQDTRRLSELLRSLCDRGHSVLAISHDPGLLARCDLLCELGPGAGPAGGRTLAILPPGELARGDTPTAASLRRELDVGDRG